MNATLEIDPELQDARRRSDEFLERAAEDRRSRSEKLRLERDRDAQMPSVEI